MFSDRCGVSVSAFERRRQRAGHEDHQSLVVSEPVERQVGDLGRLELGVNVGLVGLQQLGADCTVMLAERADLQRQIDAADLAVVTGTRDRTTSRNPRARP